MEFVFRVYVINAYIAAVLAGVTLVVWYLKDRAVVPSWRRWALACSLTAAVLNVLVFWGWDLYLLYGAQGRSTMQAESLLIDRIALPLLFVAAAGAAAGKGKARLMVVALVVSGFLVWVRPAIL